MGGKNSGKRTPKPDAVELARPAGFVPLDVNKQAFKHLRGDPNKQHVSMNTPTSKIRGEDNV
jgi:hypothetical protein